MPLLPFANAPGSGGGAGSINVSAGANSENLTNIVYSNSNGVSFGLNASTITASVAAQSNQNLSLYALGNTTQNNSTLLNASNMSFNGLGNITVGFSNGSIQVSDSQSNQQISVYATGNTFSSSSGTFNASSMMLNGLGSASVGLSNGSILVSAGGGGGGGVNIAASNTTFTSGTVVMSNNGGALTIGSGAQSVLLSVPQTSSLSATGAVSISVSSNTISIGAPNQQQQATISAFDWNNNGFGSIGAFTNGSLSLVNFSLPYNLSASAGGLAVSISGSTSTSATTASVNNSLWMGVYTMTGSTLSLASSGSGNAGYRWSQSASSTANTSINSMRLMTIPINLNMTPGQYWLGVVNSSATTYTNVGQSYYGNTAGGATGANYLATIGGNTASARAILPMQGIYSAVTGAGPASIGTSDVKQTLAGGYSSANVFFQLSNATY